MLLIILINEKMTFIETFLQFFKRFCKQVPVSNENVNLYQPAF